MKIKILALLTLVSLAGFAVLNFAAAPPRSTEKEIPAHIREAEGLADALRNLRASMVTTPVLSPRESLKHFKVPEGLAVDLIASEPEVRQPLNLTFDERGRLWVVQYKQYPFPAGLKVVAYDRYIRAKFDKVPPPPPDHFKGEDKITIHEDSKGDGSFSKITTFVDGLSIATSVLPGRGGVWVLNPPYLLFYPDKERTDKAVARPVVHLSGFGLEDTHAVASSLTWGPDGWIYGAQGSTCTAKIKVEVTNSAKTTDFLGQAIWRYHPETHRFEIYAEGGGNTFGVAFDDQGRVFSGTNWGKYRGLHYVQGGYYIKGWGKHGPLTNPYALGFFEHMPHVGNADRLTHTFHIYGGDTLPGYQGKILAVNSLQRRVQVSHLNPDRSTFTTTEDPFLLTTDDGRFRPVDIKSGPDGALYICDLYEPRINHVDPRDNWDRATGRVYRIRPENYKPAGPMDLAKTSSRELVGLLTSKNRWYREMALRVLGDRKDRLVKPLLRDNLSHETGPLALESLWALHLCGGLSEEVALTTLDHKNPHVRRWTARLLGDEGKVSNSLGKKLANLAARDADPEVRSQLASTAKRLPGSDALPILRALWTRDSDVADPHIPLLTWWALESKAESDRSAVLAMFEDRALWEQAIVKNVILERLMQRYAMAGGKINLLTCARLLELAPSPVLADRLLAGLEKAFAGGSAGVLPGELRDAVSKAWSSGARTGGLALGLRLGESRSITDGLRLLADEKANGPRRLECIRIFGEIDQPRCVPILLEVVRHSASPAVRQEALNALQRYNDPSILATVLELYPASFPEVNGVRGAAHNLLASRPAWALAFLKVIDAGKVSPRSIPLEVAQKIQLHKDAEIGKLVAKHWGRVRGSTPVEKQKEMARVIKLLQADKGNPASGKVVYTNLCGKCHRLFGEGGEVGPDLTGYERDKAMYWLENIVDPSAAIREEYTTFIIETADGRTLTGIIAAQDKATVALRDPEGRITRIARDKIDDLRASPVSLMPEGQLTALKDEQVRDLFAYLMSKAPAKK